MDGSDAGGEGGKLQPPNPPSPNKTRCYKSYFAPEQHPTSLGILGTGTGRGKVFGGRLSVRLSRKEPSAAPHNPTPLNFASFPLQHKTHPLFCIISHPT